jgi:CBS domain-containing protein
MNADNVIREIMTTNMVTVAPDASAKAVKDIFESNDFHHIPVVDRGENLVGIISKEDFFKVSYILSLSTTGRTWSEREYESLKAKDFMTSYPLALDPEDTIGLAADIFLANKFHALPIVEDNRLVGLVTTHDLLKFSFNSRIIEKEEEELEQ